MNRTELNKYPIDVFEYPDEIAGVLVKMIQEHDEISDIELIEKELVDGIYHIRTCAENSYNYDYFRILYTVLAKITENYGIYKD